MIIKLLKILKIKKNIQYMRGYKQGDIYDKS